MIMCVGLQCSAQKSKVANDSSTLNSQIIETDNSRDRDPFKVYTSVDRTPKFPGGTAAFDEYVKSNIKLPRKPKAGSGSVTVSFIVELDGSLRNVKVVKGLSTKCDSEAVRLIKSSPKWFPGIQNGAPVRTILSIPIYFKPEN